MTGASFTTGTNGYLNELYLLIRNTSGAAYNGIFHLTYQAAIATGNTTGVCNQASFLDGTGGIVQRSDDPITSSWTNDATCACLTGFETTNGVCGSQCDESSASDPYCTCQSVTT